MASSKVSNDEKSYDAIATTVQTAYRSLPKKGKPQPHEWTVLAGLVVKTATSGAQCVCLATGTKCVGKRDASTTGLTVNDNHAEILCRRALKLLLLMEIEKHCSTCFTNGAASPCTHEGLLKHAVVDGSVQFKLRDGVSSWLYISDSPCGCSAEYQDHAPVGESSESAHGSRRSGAKLIDPTAPGTDGQAHDPRVALRTKSGRSDLPADRRTNSHCCSDKVCRWLSVPGALTGGLLAHLMGTHPRQAPRLAGVVVSAGEGAPLLQSSSHSSEGTRPQLLALQAALLDRAAGAREATWATGRDDGAGSGNSAGASTSHVDPPPLPTLALSSLSFPDGRVSKASSMRASGVVPVEPGATGHGTGAGAGVKRSREEEDGQADNGAAGQTASGSSVPDAPRVSLVPCGQSIVAWRPYSSTGQAGPWEVHTIAGATGKVAGSTGKTSPWASAPVLCKAKMWVRAEAALKALRQVQQELMAGHEAQQEDGGTVMTCTSPHATYRAFKRCPACSGTTAYHQGLSSFHGRGLGFESWMRAEEGTEAFPYSEG